MAHRPKRLARAGPWLCSAVTSMHSGVRNPMSDHPALLPQPCLPGEVCRGACKHVCVWRCT